jgi:predicted lipoprotein with Yx(FWY)xxD motif
MRRIRFVALAIAFIALLGACADEDPAVQAPEETAEATDPADEATVATTESDLGEILVDAEGATLYVFMRDANGMSNCNDACAQTWPPLTADGDPTGGEGVDDELLGTTEREDGDTQVTYNDRPLYTYSGDTAAGDTEGQGVGDNWYVVGPDGEPITE